MNTSRDLAVRSSSAEAQRLRLVAIEGLMREQGRLKPDEELTPHAVTAFERELCAGGNSQKIVAAAQERLTAKALIPPHSHKARLHGHNDEETRRSLGLDDAETRQKAVKGAANMFTGPLEAYKPKNLDPERFETAKHTPIGADIIIENGKDVIIADSKGSDWVHGVQQIVATWGMYKATHEGSLMGVKPRFVISVAPDTRLAGDAHLHVHNGVVYDHRTGGPLHVDGQRIEVLAIDLVVGEE